MKLSNKPSRWSARVLQQAAAFGPVILIGAATLSLGGCIHEREHDVVVRERPRYEVVPPPPQPAVAAAAEQPAVPAAYTPPPPPAPDYSQPQPAYSQQPAAEELPPYTPPPADVMAEYGQDLTPYGQWYDVPNYGRCWAPNDRPSGWRPYTCGHWVDSDQGWTFVAEDTDAGFGAICYHYGRWFPDAKIGWLWVPGTVWGSSWCGWREGDGYCAWAPLPPQCVDGAEIDQTIVDRYVPADRYSCCEERYITESRVDRRLIADATIINRTRNITRINYSNDLAINRGVPEQNVERYLGHPVPRVQVSRAASLDEARRMVASGRPVIYAPKALETYHQSHPLRVIQPNGRYQQQAVQPGRLDQKTAEQERVRQDAEAQRLRDNNRTAAPGSPGVSPQHRTMEESATEQQRLNEQKAAQDRANQERAAQERAVQERAAQERTGQPRSAEERSAQDRAAQERESQDRAARDRAAQERSTQERGAQERGNQERSAQPRSVQEQPAQDRAAQERAAQERSAQERAAQERTAQERSAQPRSVQEQPAQDRAAQERAVQDRAAQERTTQDRAAQERPAQERAAQDRAVQERTAQDRAAQGRSAQDKAAQDRAAQERPAQERAAQDRAAQERSTQERAPQERSTQKDSQNNPNR